MKPRLLAPFAVAAATLFVSSARAQVYYMFPSARIVTENQAAIGGTVGFGDNLLRLVGFTRFNISTHSDLGLEVVVDDNDSTWRGGGAADFKYQIVPTGREMPVDLSLQGGLGVQGGGSVVSIDVPVGAVVSRPLPLRDGREIVPYGGLYVVLRHLSIDNFDDDTDVDAELRAGASFEIFQSGDLFVTLHIGDDVLFFAGFNAGL